MHQGELRHCRRGHLPQLTDSSHPRANRQPDLVLRPARTLANTSSANDGFPIECRRWRVAVRTGGYDSFERSSSNCRARASYLDASCATRAIRSSRIRAASRLTSPVTPHSWRHSVHGSSTPRETDARGPQEIVPAKVFNILELELIENNEGRSSWPIGLDQQVFVVMTTLTEPVRIVIDISVDPTGAPPTTPGPATPPSLPPTL